MSTFFSELSDYSSLSTVKDVGLGIVGVYAANKIADIIPMGGKSGIARAVKTGVSAVAVGYVGDRFLGPREGRDLAMGGLLLAGFEALSAASGGKFGAFPGGTAATPLASNVGNTNSAASSGYGAQPLITTGVTIPTTQGLANNASGVASGFWSGTGA